MISFFKRSPPGVSFEWIGTDIHSHLLPGIDDGSKDTATALTHIRALHDLGFSKFICTPHIYMELYPNSRGTITPALQSVQNMPEIQELGVDISAAAEYMMNTDFDVLLAENDLMLLPGNYVLIEMSYQVETRNIEQYIFDLNIKGYKPILAHPERYNFYHGSMTRLQRLKDMDCLMQLNLLSLTGYYGKEVKQAGLRLLKNNLYDLVGTDFHHENHLRAMRDAALWQSTLPLIKDYPFRNKELFG